MRVLYVAHGVWTIGLRSPYYNKGSSCLRGVRGATCECAEIVAYDVCLPSVTSSPALTAAQTLAVSASTKESLDPQHNMGLLLSLNAVLAPHTVNA